MTISKIYQEQQARTQQDLERRIENQARKLTELQKLIAIQKDKLQSANDLVKNKALIISKRDDQLEFLKARIIQIHGKGSLENILNHVDNPDRFTKEENKNFTVKEVL